MFQGLIRFLFIIGAIVYLIFYYNISKAQRQALDDDIPSLTKLHELQYCLTDSDCELVLWNDCNECNYIRAINSRYALYFRDNVDYYNYPAGFNRRYCQALESLLGPEAINPLQQVECRDPISKELPLRAACDPLIKQCYALCERGDGGETKCVADRYGNKIYDIFIAPHIYNEKEAEKGSA